MEFDEYTCNNCGEEKERFRLEGTKPCYGDTCCDCCKKKGLQTESCELSCLEAELILNGKELNEYEKKGLLLERAISTTLDILNIPHKHNPFKLYYSNYQIDNPDIIINDLDAIIECKNLNEKQAKKRISKVWLDKHIINRPNTSKYSLKMALFSYKPPKSLIKYLEKHNYRVYGLGFQILNVKQEKKAIPRLKQQFWWLKKKYEQKQDSARKQIQSQYLP